jgi:ABC-2 type transport system ATP-binding protein
VDTLISIEGLEKSYSGKTVLNNINLTVEAGQILGLVGANGAGKTTCLQALLGLISCSGNISVAGFNPKKQRAKMLNDVAYISDVAVLPKWMKVKQAISYMEGIHPNFDANIALSFLGKTNIELSSKVKQLSKGMVTQLHLALILAIDAKVLVLDEPTLGLDILTRRQFYTHLIEDFYTSDKCIVITTHQIEEIEHLLTNVAFIRNGKIIVNEATTSLEARFKLLNVASNKLALCEEFSPIFTNTIMGMSTLLIDCTLCTTEQISMLEDIGEVRAPSMADIFVATMSQEINK